MLDGMIAALGGRDQGIRAAGPSRPGQPGRDPADHNRNSVGAALAVGPVPVAAVALVVL